MNSRLRNIVVTAVIALVAGFAGVGIGRFAFDRPPPPPGLHEVIHHELNLTPEQTRQIASLEADFAARRQALELEMRAANAELASAIREEHGYGPRVTAAVERFHRAMGALQTEMIRHLFAMREVLTPAQKAKFDDTVVTALTNEPQ